MNGLALTGDGSAAYTVAQTGAAGQAPTIQRYDAVSGAVDSFAGPALTQTTTTKPTLIMGAINPVNGDYYFALNSPIGLQVYGFDTTTNTPVPGRVAVVRQIPDRTFGDMAFDSDGRLYIVTASGDGTPRANPLYLVPGAFPTGGDVQVGYKTLSFLEPTNAQFTSAAFSGGYLYVGGTSTDGSNFLNQVDPGSGDLVASRNLTQGTVQDTGLADFASCQSPYPLRARADIVNRVDADDEFTLTVASAGPAESATGTTAGGRLGLRNEPAETAGPLLSIAGRTYTATETAGNATTNLDDYTTTYACTRNADRSVVTSGRGRTASFVYPTPPPGQGIGVTCIFTNSVTGLSLTKTNPAALTVGKDAAYTFAVTNNGARPVTGATVTDQLPAGIEFVRGGGTGWTCTAAGPLVTCTLDAPIAAGAADAGLSITVRPTVASTGTAVTNRASVDPTGGPTPPPPADCTETGVPAGCAVSPPQTPQDAPPPPRTTSDEVSTPPGEPVAIDLRENDPSREQVGAPKIVAPPTKGTVTINRDGTATYTPRTGTSGVDTFTYRVCALSDPTDCSAATSVRVDVASRVTARDDRARTPAGTPVRTPVLDNDSVLPGGAPLDPASVTVTRAPEHGSTVVGTDGSVTYTPGSGYAGPDTYRYQVCDTSSPERVCGQAEVRVTVDPVAAVPVLNPPTAFVGDAGRPITVLTSTGRVEPVTSSRRLASTGSELMVPGALGVGALVLGGLLVGLTRRRGTRHHFG